MNAHSVYVGRTKRGGESVWKGGYWGKSGKCGSNRSTVEIKVKPTSNDGETV